MKSATCAIIFFLCTGVSYGQGTSPHPSPRQAVTPNPSALEIRDLPHFTRYDYVRSPRDPFLDKSVTTTIMSAYRPSIIDKLVLLSWLNEPGQTVIYVQNTETNEVQRITSEPNKDNFRIVEVRPNADSKLFEVVISNGNEKGPVKFRENVPIPNPQPTPATSPAAPAKNPQTETVSPRAPQKKN